MSITHYTFFIFVAVTVLVYYITPLKVRQWIPFIASTVFYIWSCNIPLFLLMCGLALFVWDFTLTIEKEKDGLKSKLAVGVIIILGATLIIFKDLKFFTTNIHYLSRVIGKNVQIEPPAWAAPLGISYFTLMLIGYILDVTWGKISAERNPLKVILFTCYFPQMVSGPFTRYDEMSGELFVGHKFDYDNFTFGLQRMVWGLFKKLVISERFAIIQTTIYGNYETLGGGYVLLGAMCYVGRVYTDFSGCMDIIMGVSQMLGIKLPENFQQPFNSRNLSELWRRWHITLGSWVRDYIMYPLQKYLTTKHGNKLKQKIGKKNSKRLILYSSMFVTWFFVGFWHGGTWNYISFGIWSFIFIVGGELLTPLFNRLTKFLRVNTEAWSWHLFQSLRTFFLFTFSVSFQPAASLSDGFRFWKTGLTHMRANFVTITTAYFDKSIYSAIGLDQKDCNVLILSSLLLLVVSTLQLKGSLRERIAEQNLPFRWILYFGMFFAVIIFGMYGIGYNPADFLYAGF